MMTDEYFMQQAIKEAMKAYDDDEVPIGAIVVCNSTIIGKGYNQVERLKDATAHAEMIAITAAENYLGNKYLLDCTLYVTVEPCVMCAGAASWTKVTRVVYGAAEEKFGFTRIEKNLLHPKTLITKFVLQSECEALVKNYFQTKRN
jgi:tRNA(adenine34) deaminase